LQEELKTDSDLALPLNPELRQQLLNELTERTAINQWFRTEKYRYFQIHTASN